MKKRIAVLVVVAMVFSAFTTSTAPVYEKGVSKTIAFTPPATSTAVAGRLTFSSNVQMVSLTENDPNKQISTAKDVDPTRDYDKFVMYGINALEITSPVELTIVVTDNAPATVQITEASFSNGLAETVPITDFSFTLACKWDIDGDDTFTIGDVLTLMGLFFDQQGGILIGQIQAICTALEQELLNS